MKIVFLARRFWPDIGGVEKHVEKLSEELIKKGHSIVVITESKGKTGKYKGIEINRIDATNNWFKKFQIWKWMIKNRKLFKDVDLVHAHDVHFWYWPLKFIYLSKKSYVTFHGYESYPIALKAKLIRKISEKLADGNIIVGKFIEKYYGTKADEIIYGAVSLPNSLRETNDPSAIFIGRLDDQTSIMQYVVAVDKIKVSLPNFKFEVIGDGKYFNKLKKYNPKGFMNNPLKELEKYNFAFVSRYLGILEALAYKKLVFALYEDGVKEDYLKMSPFSNFIVIESSPEKLAEKVIYFLNHKKEKEKMINEGYKWVKEQSWENLAEKYIKLWNKN